MSEDLARRAAEAAARASYGRLVAMLAVKTRDIHAAEDALSEAFAAALRTWPERGVPSQPEAWLLTAARNKVKNERRHGQVRQAHAMELLERMQPEELHIEGLSDERLRLLFVCAHPAIDESIRTPLMLQTVLGLDARRIASAFVVAPVTMGQRLVRAKAKIRDAGLRFAVPEPGQWSERLADVLSAVYVAFGTGWDGVAGADEGSRDLTDEAIFLGRLLVSLLPDEPEPKGLLALMLYCESRRAARRDGAGEFVPLDEQDTSSWNRTMIMEAERLLIAASQARTFGRFQCEAAIQSVHAQRAIAGLKNHGALQTLYDMLWAHAPSLGVQVGRAAALLDAGHVDAAGAALDDVSMEQVRTYQPYWVVRAHLHIARGQAAEAHKACSLALGLTEDGAVRRFLQRRLAELVPG